MSTAGHHSPLDIIRNWTSCSFGEYFGASPARGFDTSNSLKSVRASERRPRRRATFQSPAVPDGLLVRLPNCSMHLARSIGSGIGAGRDVLVLTKAFILEKTFVLGNAFVLDVAMVLEAFILDVAFTLTEAFELDDAFALA